MVIIPDDKDWTWVLSRPCPECGFDASKTTPAAVATTIPALMPRWQSALKRSGVEVRPNEYTWSVLEYACHVRDLFDVFETRLQLMLTENEPTFANWDQNLTAVEEDYGSQDPREVYHELVQAGSDVADAFGAVTAEQWARRGFRSNGSEFTVMTLSGYFLHDVIHHLHDVSA